MFRPIVSSLQRRDGLDLDDDDLDVPSEEMLERMEEKLEAAQSEQKNLFLIIFQVRKSEGLFCALQLRQQIETSTPWSMW